MLLETVDTKPLADPRLLKFKAGQRKSPWIKNVVSLGLASGFLEPLESTSIHLVQSSLRRLVAYFPTRDFDPLTIDEFNRLTRQEWEDIRDFIILHFYANQRTDTEFWKYCSAMELPENLQNKIDHFRNAGRFVTSATELFKKPSWFAVFMGQFIEPHGLSSAGRFAPQRRCRRPVRRHRAMGRASGRADARAWRLHRPQRRRAGRGLKRPSRSGAPRRAVLRTSLPRGAAYAAERRRMPRRDPLNLIRLTPA